MNSITFYGFIICLLQLSLAAYVSDLNPSTDCPALLSAKATEREKDPTLVRPYLRFILSGKKETLGCHLTQDIWTLLHLLDKWKHVGQANRSKVTS